MKITGILLAAGFSTRFKTNKIIHKINNKLEMGVASWMNLDNVVKDSYVVLNKFDHESFSIFKREGANIIGIENSQLGISNSIKEGITETINSDAWIIALADMPYVEKSIIRNIYKLLKKEHDIVVPTFEGKMGNPVGIKSKFKNDLLRLRGDNGAKTIIMSNYESVTKLPVNSSSINFDIDYQNDLKKFTL